MNATGFIGDLRDLVIKDLAKADGGLKPRPGPLMDLVTAITRGKKVTLWNDEPEAKLLGTKYLRNDPIWGYIDLKIATKYGREIAQGKLKAIQLENLYGGIPSTFVMTEPREPIKDGSKPSKFVISLDTPHQTVIWHLTFTPNRTRTKWVLLMSQEGGNYSEHPETYVGPNALDNAIKAGFRKLCAATSRQYAAGIKKVKKHLGLVS